MPLNAAVYTSLFPTFAATHSYSYVAGIHDAVLAALSATSLDSLLPTFLSPIGTVLLAAVVTAAQSAYYAAVRSTLCATFETAI